VTIRHSIEKDITTMAKVWANTEDITAHEEGDVFWSVGRERILLNLSGEDTTLAESS